MSENFKLPDFNSNFKIDQDKLKELVKINDPIQNIYRESIQRHEKLTESIYEQKQAEKREKEEHYQETKETAERVKQLENQLNSIWHTLDIMYMSMGAQSQRATREHIEIKELITEYMGIMLNNQNGVKKDSLLKEFFRQLPLEIAFKIIVDAGIGAFLGPH